MSDSRIRQSYRHRSHYEISWSTCNLYALKDMIYHALSSQYLPMKKHNFATTVPNPLKT